MSKKFLVDILAKAGLTVEGTTNLQGPATAVTVASNDNSTKIATTAFVRSQGYLSGITYSNVTSALGYTPVPDSRTITINGTTYDLSANRAWTITTDASARSILRYVATANQTTFAISGGYTPGLTDVYRNGVKLDNSTDFTATNGTTIVLTNGASVNDVIEVYRYQTAFLANNALRTVTEFIATAGQTTFNVLYNSGLVDVFYNGSKLLSTEYTAGDGDTIVLNFSCNVNDTLEVHAYSYAVGAFVGQSQLNGTGFVKVSGTTVSYDNSTYLTSINSSQITTALGYTPYNATNPSGYITSSALSAYLPLSGGTLTGALSGTSATFSGNLGVGVSSITNPVGFTRVLNIGGLDAALVLSNTDGTAKNWTLGALANGSLGLFDASAARLTISSTGAATFSSSVTLTNGFLSVDAFGNKDTNYITMRSGFVPSTSGGIGFMATDHSGSGQDGLACYGHDGISFYTAQTERMRITSGGQLLVGMTSANYGVVSIKSNSATTYYGLNIYANANDRFISVNHTGGYGVIEVENSGSGVMTDLAFRTGANERMRINTSGQILTPSQPAFMAYGNGNASVDASGTYMIYPSVHFNRGSHYNSSTGVFTVPVSGLYFFSWSAIGNNGNDVYRWYLRVNNVNFLSDTQLRQDTTDTGSAYADNGNRQVLANLTAGSTVRIWFSSDSGGQPYGVNATDNAYLNFMGYLIG